MKSQLQKSRRYFAGKGVPLHFEYETGWGTEFIAMLWRAENYPAPVSNQNSIPRSSSPSIVTKPTELSRLHYLHASTANVSVTIDCLTHSLALPRTPPASIAQFWLQPTHFIASTLFFTFEARYFSS